MNREERERLVDSVLDRALGPQAAEPRAGFEERILANLAAQPQPRPWWRRLWVPALAAAAVVLAIVLGIQALRRPAPTPIEAKQNPPQTQEKLPVIAKASVEKPATPRMAKRSVMRRPGGVQVARATPPLPRQDVFPAPLSLTEQERLLFALVQRQPEEAQMVAQNQQAERERIQKYFETGEAPVAAPTAERDMR